MSRKSIQEKLAAELADLGGSSSFPLKKRHRSEPVSAPVSSVTFDDDRFSDESELEDDGLNDDLFKDEEDERRLMAMPEFEREKILFERAERRRDIQERNQLRLEQRRKRRQELGRETGEPPQKKVKTSHRAALEDMKKKRSKRENRDEIYDAEDESDEDIKRTKKTKKIYGDDEDDLDYMDVDEIKPTKTPKKAKEDKPPKEPQETLIHEPKEDRMDLEDIKREEEEAASLEVFSQVVIGRNQVERWFGEPYWNDVIRGLYCKVSVGQNPSLPGEDKNVYRIAEIVDLQESNKAYKLGQKECNALAVLGLQGKTKNFEFKYFSNRPITEEEYSYFKTVQLKARRHLLTDEEVKDLYMRTVKVAEEYRYTEADVDMVVKRNLAKLKDSIHSTKDKTRLREEIEECLAEGNESRAQELQARLDEILKKEEEMMRAAELRRAVRVSELNLARRANYFKQQDEERELTLQRELAELEGRVSIDDDPFARRKTYGGDFKKPELAAAPSSEENSQKSVETNSSTSNNSLAPAVALSDLDDVLEAASSKPKALVVNSNESNAVSSNNPHRKTISLEEYKRKKMMMQ